MRSARQKMVRGWHRGGCEKHCQRPGILTNKTGEQDTWMCSELIRVTAGDRSDGHRGSRVQHRGGRLIAVFYMMRTTMPDGVPRSTAFPLLQPSPGPLATNSLQRTTPIVPFTSWALCPLRPRAPALGAQFLSTSGACGHSQRLLWAYPGGGLMRPANT